MDYSINIKPLFECYTFGDQNDEKVMSIEERHGSQLKSSEHDEDELETVGEGVGLVFQYESTSQKMSGNNNTRIIAKQVLQRQFAGENASVRKVVHGAVEMIKHAGRAGASAACIDDALPAGHGKRPIENDTPIPQSAALATAIEEPGPDSARNKISTKQEDGLAISGHERVTLKNISYPEMSASAKNGHNRADRAPVEQSMNHGDSSVTEMIWHFRSWGNREKHKARLVFTDLDSPDSKVKIIPSDEIVRNALIKHQQSEVLSDLRIEFAVSDENRREGEKHEPYSSEDEEDQI